MKDSPREVRRKWLAWHWASEFDVRKNDNGREYIYIFEETEIEHASGSRGYGMLAGNKKKLYLPYEIQTKTIRGE